MALMSFISVKSKRRFYLESSKIESLFENEDETTSIFCTGSESNYIVEGMLETIVKRVNDESHGVFFIKETQVPYGPTISQ